MHKITADITARFCNTIFYIQATYANSRPSSTKEEYDEYEDREYRAAEWLGEQVEGENCHALYPECRKSVLDVFSTLIT